MGPVAKSHPTAILANFKTPGKDFSEYSHIYMRDYKDNLWIAFVMPDEICKSHVVLWRSDI